MIKKVYPLQKRAELKNQLASGKTLRFIGAYSPLVATLIEKLSFEGVYVSGAVLANDLGLPDIGLTTQDEVAYRSRQINRITSLPSLVDIDTGFGETMNFARTIEKMEDAGIAAVHFEDQTNPKRCGHLDNKELVPASDVVKKIKAGVEIRKDKNFILMARTDAAGVEGIDKAIERAKKYVDAGADAIFPESLKNYKEFEMFRKAIDVPLLANMTEFGKSELLSFDELSAIGYNIILYPVTTQRLAMKNVEMGLKEIQKSGHQKNLLDKMQTRKELYDLIEYEKYNKFDKQIYNFELD